MENKYTEEEISKAVLELNNRAERPENMEFTLYKEALKSQTLKNRLHLKGTFEHISAQLIPKLNKDGKIMIPVQWIGKTKGTSYINHDKQEKRLIELFAYYMSKNMVDKANETSAKIDNLIRRHEKQM